MHPERKETLHKYQPLWDLARPYYEKGRPMDIEHIEWMMQDAVYVCEQEGLDDSLLLPVVILHDVGYSQVPDVASQNYYELDIRKLHMEEGAKIARTILEQVEYPAEKIDTIVYDISVHDNWAYGEVQLFIDDPILGTFKDLDYLWPYSKEGFHAIAKARNMSTLALLEELRAEESPVYGNKPFSNKTTQALHDHYIQERIQEVTTT